MDDDWPKPTQAEADTLKRHIVGWLDLEPLERGVCLAVLRNYHSIPAIATYLRVPRDLVKSRASKNLVGKGLLWDNHQLIIH